MVLCIFFCLYCAVAVSNQRILQNILFRMKFLVTWQLLTRWCLVALKKLDLMKWLSHMLRSHSFIYVSIFFINDLFIFQNIFSFDFFSLFYYSHFSSVLVYRSKMNPHYNQPAPNFQAPPPLPQSNYNGNQLPPNVISIWKAYENYYFTKNRINWDKICITFIEFAESNGWPVVEQWFFRAESTAFTDFASSFTSTTAIWKFTTTATIDISRQTWYDAGYASANKCTTR